MPWSGPTLSHSRKDPFDQGPFADILPPVRSASKKSPYAVLPGQTLHARKQATPRRPPGELKSPRLRVELLQEPEHEGEVILQREGEKRPAKLPPIGGTLQESFSKVSLKSKAHSQGSSRKLRPAIPGLPAPRHEIKEAYNLVDLDVAENLELKLEELVRDHEGVAVWDARGVYVLLERCHSCREHHGSTTRHDELEYAARCKGVLSHVLRHSRGLVLGAAELLCQLAVEPRCLGNSYELGEDIWHHGSRVGAFEVYFLAPKVMPVPEGGGSISMWDYLGVDSLPDEHARAAECWGAKRELPCGYVATLLHSKLCSKTWPGRDMLSRRLASALPLGNVEIKVLCPSGTFLSNFDVEVRFGGSSAGLPAMEQPDLIGRGKDGTCHIQGVPLKTELEIRAMSPAMATQAVRVVTMYGTASITFVSDVVLRLWAVDAPGGLSVLAGDFTRTSVPDAARPFRGEVALSNGERLTVDGLLRLPWRGQKVNCQGVHVLPSSSLPGQDGTTESSIRNAPSDVVVFGHDVTEAVAVKIPTVGLMKSWTQDAAFDPLHALKSRPVAEIFKALQELITSLQLACSDRPGSQASVRRPNSSPTSASQIPASSPFAARTESALDAVQTDMVGFALAWDVACRTMDIYLQAARDRQLPAPLLWQAYDGVLGFLANDTSLADIDALCTQLTNSESARSMRAELDRLELAVARENLGERLAVAYAGAARMKPWLDALCGSVAAESACEMEEVGLKGACGSTRAIQKACLYPEEGLAWDIVRCRLNCGSLQGLCRALDTLQAAVARCSPLAAIVNAVAISDTASSKFVPSAAGTVVVQLAWRGPDSLDPPQVAEVQLAHVALRRLAPIRAGQLEEDLRAEFAQREQQEGGEASVRAIEQFRELTVPGYHPAAPSAHIRKVSMKDMVNRDWFELAQLPAPQVKLQVVMPGSKLPLTGVRVADRQDQIARTDSEGWCTMVLAPGSHVLRMRHEAFPSSWVEQSIVVNSMSPTLELPMKITLFAWRSPIKIRGDVFAWQYWIGSSPGWEGDESIKQYVGKVETPGGDVLQIEDGQVVLEPGPVVVLGEQKPFPSPGTSTQDPLAGFSLEPPYTRRLGVSGNCLRQDWLPWSLGTRPEDAMLPSDSNSAGKLVVLARTLCCGCGVSGVQVSAGERMGSTDADGALWLSPDDSSGDSTCLWNHSVVSISHLALAGGCEDFTACAAGPEASSEVPVFFEVQVRVFVVPGPRGRRLLQVLAGGEESGLDLPSGAEAFRGLLTGDAGEEYCCAYSGGADKFEGGILPLNLQVERLTPSSTCPVFELFAATAEESGFEWVPDPSRSSIQASGSCGLQMLLRSSEPVTLGCLRPVVEVLHVDSKVMKIPVEECEDVARAKRLLGKMLGMDDRGMSLVLGPADNVGSWLEGGRDAEISVRRVASAVSTLEDSSPILPGRPLRLLSRLTVHVTFGNTGIGFPGAKLAMQQGSRLRWLATTDASGTCELLVPAGHQVIEIQHGMVGKGTESMELTINTLESYLHFAVPALLFVYCQAPHEGDSEASATSVFLCAQPQQLPATAWPVSGHMEIGEVGGAEDSALKVLDGVVLRSVDLSSQAGLARAGLRLRELGAEAGFLWRQEAPVLLEKEDDWQKLLQGPMLAGKLFPPVTLQSHRLADDRAELVVEQLPAAECQTVAQVCKTVGPAFNLPSAKIGIFQGPHRLSSDADVQAWSTLDVWALADINICLRSSCCSRGHAGAVVEVDAEFLRKAEESGAASGSPEHEHADWTSAATGADGCCKLVAPATDLCMRVTHPLLSKDQGTRQVHGSSDEAASLELHPSFDIFLFTTQEGDGFVVWCAKHAEEVPEEAQTVAAAYVFLEGGDVEDPLVIPWSQGREDSVQLPEHWVNAEPGQPCPLLNLVVEPIGEEEQGDQPPLAWRPRRSVDLADVAHHQDDVCFFNELSSGPVVIGHWLPALTVHGPGLLAKALRLPVTSCPTVEALQQLLALRLSRAPEALGLYAVGEVALLDPSHRLLAGAEVALPDPSHRLLAGAEVTVRALLPLALQVLLPDSQTGEGLEGVAMEVDGIEVGRTGSDGSLRVMLPEGPCCPVLKHACFGPEGKRLQLEELAGDGLRLELLADVRLYFYATDPDEPSENEEEDDDQEVQTVLPSVVFVCASQDQIPEGAFCFDGVASITVGELPGSTEVQSATAELSTEQSFGLLQVSGQQIQDAAAAFSLGSLRLHASRLGYCWKAKEPMPLEERAAELEGSEYLRLLECPVALGFFHPAVRCTLANKEGITMEFSIIDSPTVGALRAQLMQELGTEPPLELRLWQLPAEPDGLRRLLGEDSEAIEASWDVAVEEMAPVPVRVVTSCCLEPLKEVEVLLEGAVGVSDEEGRCEIFAPLGQRALTLRHPALGPKGRESRQVEVGRERSANEVIFCLDARLFVYQTDPDPEEEEGAEQDPEEAPLYDMSPVWLAADPGHLPEDAKPIECCLTCPWPDAKRLFRAGFGPESLGCVELGPGEGAATPEASTLKPGHVCPVVGLRLRCKRDGFSWAPKEPSPLAERTEEFGGCELLRVMECPVALGFFKPSVTVFLATGERLLLPLDTYGEVSALRMRLAEELKASDQDSLLLEAADGSGPVAGSYLPGSMTLLCATAAEDMAAAKRHFQQWAQDKARSEAAGALLTGDEQTEHFDVVDLEATSDGHVEAE
eukprot:TRINITY_DN7677_c0_g1_i1.p1 TRINITY_DN7677_c0_g1~~TRINITY_DN7677_c0_g1_i1.p1  ORF type:complete len:2688 (-),score=571.77 TRINITY_DN7677_c0_g1_i1:33-8096(-)